MQHLIYLLIIVNTTLNVNITNSLDISNDIDMLLNVNREKKVIEFKITNDSQTKIVIDDYCTMFNRIVIVDHKDNMHPYYFSAANAKGEIVLNPGEHKSWIDSSNNIWNFAEKLGRERVEIFWQVFDKFKSKKPKVPTTNLSDYYQEYRSETLTLN